MIPSSIEVIVFSLSYLYRGLEFYKMAWLSKTLQSLLRPSFNYYIFCRLSKTIQHLYSPSIIQLIYYEIISVGMVVCLLEDDPVEGIYSWHEDGENFSDEDLISLVAMFVTLAYHWAEAYGSVIMITPSLHRLRWTLYLSIRFGINFSIFFSFPPSLKCFCLLSYGLNVSFNLLWLWNLSFVDSTFCFLIFVKKIDSEIVGRKRK